MRDCVGEMADTVTGTFSMYDMVLLVKSERMVPYIIDESDRA